jgi:hypothetical protein
MPIFEIKKPLIATLRVECSSREEALSWADRIVATIEDENGNPVGADQVDYFEAETTLSEILITKEGD